MGQGRPIHQLAIYSLKQPHPTHVMYSFTIFYHMSLHRRCEFMFVMDAHPHPENEDLRYKT